MLSCMFAPNTAMASSLVRRVSTTSALRNFVLTEVGETDAALCHQALDQFRCLRPARTRTRKRSPATCSGSPQRWGASGLAACVLIDPLTLPLLCPVPGRHPGGQYGQAPPAQRPGVEEDAVRPQEVLRTLQTRPTRPATGLLAAGRGSYAYAFARYFHRVRDRDRGDRGWCPRLALFFFATPFPTPRSTRARRVRARRAGMTSPHFLWSGCAGFPCPSNQRYPKRPNYSHSPRRPPSAPDMSVRTSGAPPRGTR